VQGLVELRCSRLQFRELRPGDLGEIVVLVVISDVARHVVDGSVVRVCLLKRLDRPMLCDPSRTERMEKETDGEQGGEQVVAQSLCPDEGQGVVDERDVENPVEDDGRLDGCGRTESPDGLENGEKR